MTAASDRRIVILGASGSGKTTLSRALARQLSLPVIHLDSLAAASEVDPGALHAPIGQQPSEPFVPRPLPDRRRMADELAAASDWIAEGAFIDWTEPFLDRADTILWLDHVGPLTTTKRILARTRTSTVVESRRHRGLARFVRPRAYVHHGLELLSELWHANGYFWRRAAPAVSADIAARRWDRINRHAVSVSLEPHRSKVIHVRDGATLLRIERSLGLDPETTRALAR
jgi:MoxR-like ATPase